MSADPDTAAKLSSRWIWRCLALACVIALPFLGFLASQHYPPFRAEAAIALVCLLAACAVLAAIFRRTAFYGVVLLCGSVVAAVPMQREIHAIHAVSAWYIWLALVVLGAALMSLARENFFRLLAVFALSALAAHAWHAHGSGPAEEAAAVAPNSAPSHFLYLVLDEHIGPAGLPSEIPECRNAAESIRGTFARYGFTLFPFAYSNFPETLDSLPNLIRREVAPNRPSFLNRGLPDAFGSYSVDARPFFAAFEKRGYDITIVQHRWIRWSGASHARVVEYGPELGPLAHADIPWLDKFRLLVGSYQASDEITSAVRGFFPFRFGAKAISPVSTSGIWPEGLAREILNARRPTLFFAHIMMPHGPYLYRKDGSVRDVAEWGGDQGYNALSRERYVERYTRYAGQVECVQRQLGWLLESLRQHSLLERMTIVVHGDHGSRIRLAAASSAGAAADPRMYDYSGHPDLQDVLNRFSALLAIRLPGGHGPSVLQRKASVLRVLSETVCHSSKVDPTVDSAFLFDRHGDAKKVPLAELWETGAGAGR